MEHRGFSRRSFSTCRHDSSSSSHKSMRQNLDRMESTVTAIPQALGEYMECFNSFCMSGIKLSSLLETMFQDTPVLLVALRFREACEQLNDKCSKATVILKGEIIPPVTKKLAPSLCKLRSKINEHAKALSKYESHVKQLENLSSSQNPNKQKLEQLEAKFQTSATDFANEDAHLAEARNEVQKIRVEVMGSCFLSFLEAQSKLLTSASDLMAPLGDYREVGEGLKALANPMIKEATVGWLAAAQVNQNLRSFGNLSRNDVQCMVSNHRDGLPSTISRGLNMKVDQLLKKYATELKHAPNPHHKVIGGFHLNAKGIQLALRDCCSELEAKGAGAPHAQTKAEKEEQVNRDIPRVSYKIMEEEFGCAFGEDVQSNIEAKRQAILKLIQSLPLYLVLEGEDEKVEEFTFNILNESCTTVTNTPAKTAVQLVFGKANLVLVRPSPLSEDNHSVVITPCPVDSSVSIIVQSSWWLVEDYAVFSMLGRSIEPSSCLGVVDVIYTIDLKLQSFIRDGYLSELSSISVTYRQDPKASPSSEITSLSLKDKENPLHSLNRTLKTFLSAKRRSHSPRNGGHQHGPGGSGGRGGESQEHEQNKRQNGSFQSYIKEVEGEEKCERGGEGGRWSSSSGSSPLSNSPGGERRRPTEDGYPKVEKGRKMVGEDGDMEEEEEYKQSSKHRYSRRERGGGGARDSEVIEPGSSGGGGTSSSHSTFTKGSSGRSDSLGRGLKAFSHSQLRRYPSNESMSSQSTLVPKQGYEHDDSMGIADILRPTAPGHGLTQSNIRDHVDQEARKHGHGKHYVRHPIDSRRQRDEEEEEFEYGKVKNGYGSNRRRGIGGGLAHDEGRDSEGRGQSGRRDSSEVKEVDEGSESPLDMHVSPANENVNIASESEVQNVIAFLSGDNSYDSGFEYQHKSTNDGVNVDAIRQKQVEYPFRPMEYGSHVTDHMTDYHGGQYGGVVGEGDTGEGVWSSPVVADRQDSEKLPRERNVALGRQGEGSGGSVEEGYVSVARDQAACSRSASISPRVEGEEREDLRGTQPSTSGKEGGGGGGKDEQRYRQQQHHKLHSKRKGSWRDQPHSDNGRDAQELSLVLSKGFGQLITSEPGRTGGMDLLRESPDYQLSLRLLKDMNDDSDSEISGGGSIPLVSSSSSENQSPILPRTRSAENVNDNGRSLSRTSTRSVPFSAGHDSAHHLEDQFNHAPGTRLPHSKVGGGGLHFSKFDYDDLSQCSYNGGRGSNSQDSNDPPWDWGVDQRSRSHHYEYNKHLCEYNTGLLHSRGSYDSAVTQHQERQPCPMPRTIGTRSLDDYSQCPGMGLPLFDRGVSSMALPGSLSSGAPPPHGGIRPPPGGGGPPGQYCPPPQHRPGPSPGPGSIPPSSQGGNGPGPMPHLSGPGSMPLHHGHNRPLPPCGPPGGGPPPFHVYPSGGPPHPHLNGGPPHPLGGGPPPPINGGPPPPPGHNHPLWYDSFEPPRIHGPIPPLPGSHPPPSGPPPPHHSNSIHDNRFRPVPFAGGRSNTPSDAPSPSSMHSMSPGPSPHPTPPPTPPPNMGGGPPPHHSPMMHPGRPPCPPGPNVGLRHVPPPGHPIRVPRPSWEGPNRDFRSLPPSHHVGGRGPPIGHRPPQNMPGPPMPMYSSGCGNNGRYPNQIPEWERNSWHH